MNNLKVKELLQGKRKKVEREVTLAGESVILVINRLSAGQLMELATVQQKSITIKHVDEQTQEMDYEVDYKNMARNDLEYKSRTVFLGVDDVFEKFEDVADLEEEDLQALFEAVADLNGMTANIKDEVKDFRQG